MLHSFLSGPIFSKDSAVNGSPDFKIRTTARKKTDFSTYLELTLILHIYRMILDESKKSFV